VSWISILAVAVGGAIGSVARYLVAVGSARLFGFTFPWGTLIVNVFGSFILGALAGAFALKWDASQATRIMLTVGFCGGFTTFSTFSLDFIHLVERGAWGAGVFYGLASVVLSIVSLLGGLYLMRIMVQSAA
jgi:CrcB protein